MYLYLIYLFKKDPDAQERCQQGYLYLVGLRTSPGLPARFETMLQNRPQIWGSQTMDWIGRLPLDGKDGLCGVRLEKTFFTARRKRRLPFQRTTASPSSVPPAPPPAIDSGPALPGTPDR